MSADMHLDDATRPMDLARFLLNALYGAILRSKTEPTDRSMKLFRRFAREPLVIERKKT